MNLCNITEVRKLMSRHHTDVKKSLGQNFLINFDIPYNTAEESFAYHKETKGEAKAAVLEIGAGIGALTSELCKRYDKVAAVEIDKTLIPILNETLAEYDNLKVINGDFLKLDLQKLIDENFGDTPVSVCANLPYYITTPIIMKLLEQSYKNGKNRLTSITVMVQNEVAQRLCATPKDSEYGAITASVNYYGRVKKLFEVSPDNFLPAPKVTSAVLRIELYDEIPYSVISEKMLFEVIAGAFAQRRKTLINSLASHFDGMSKERIANIITKLGFDTNIRGERLGVNDFCRIADEIYGEKQCLSEQ